jgi:hypothetical protein
VSLAEAAAHYSEFDWALLELDGKNPRHHGWERTKPLHADAAYDIWAGRPQSNIGLVLGPSGVIDYEMDGGRLEDYLALVGGRIPDTSAYKTGSGKLHILFRDPGGLSRRTRDGFELRAGNHQSVLPPSIHPETGKPYEWINHPSSYNLLDPPPTLLDFFSAAASGGPPQGHWRQPLSAGKKLGEGEGRHASLISFLGRAVNIFDNVEQLTAAALFYSQESHDPPYPDAVVEEHAHDVWHRYREEPDVEEATDYLGLRTLDKVVMKSVKFLMEPFLQRSAFHLLVGRKGAGKGSVISWLAAQMTAGQLDDSARPVLWIATEDSFEIDVKPRIVAQGGDPSMIYTVSRRVRLPEDLPHIEAACKEHGVGMVVVDPIVGVIGPANTNDEGSIVAAIGGLNDLADRLDLMVLGVRHLGKNVERGILESVLGSAAWVNTPRVVLGLAQDEDEKIVTLQVLAGNRTRSRAAYDFKLVEARVDGVKVPVSKVIPVGDSDTDISEVLERKPRGKKYEAVKAFVLEQISTGDPCSTQGLFPLMQEEVGASKDTLDGVIKELKDSGQIKFLPRAKDETGKFAAGSVWLFVEA